MICVCVEKKEVATHIVEVARAAFPLARIYARAYDRVHSLELIEKGVDYQMRETYESAIEFGRAALEGLELPGGRINEVEAELRTRDKARFVLQQQGDARASLEQIATRPVPRPEPIIEPKRRGIKLVS